MAVILNLASNQPPSSISAVSVPGTMRTGRWKFTFTSTVASTVNSSDGSSYMQLFDYGGSDEIWHERTGSLRVVGTGIDRTIPCTYNASQAVTVEFNGPTGDIVISGAATGNGTSTGGAFSFNDTSTFYIGQYRDGFGRFNGTFSNVEDFSTTAITGVATANVTSPTLATSGATLTISGTAAPNDWAPGFLNCIAATGSLANAGTAATSVTDATVAATGSDGTPTIGGAAASTMTSPTTAATGALAIAGTAASSVTSPSASSAGEGVSAGTAAASVTSPTAAAFGAFTAGIPIPASGGFLPRSTGPQRGGAKVTFKPPRRESVTRARWRI